MSDDFKKEVGMPMDSAEKLPVGIRVMMTATNSLRGSL